MPFRTLLLSVSLLALAAAAEAGADAIGLVFYARSPRAVSIQQARAIVAALPPFVSTVGLFVDADLEKFMELEEACPTTAIQLTPDFEMGEFKRQDLVYEKEDLLISGPGKNPDYNFYRVSGMAIAGKPKGAAQSEAEPINVKGLLP